MEPLAIGIDLGTTYSVIAYLDTEGRPQVIPNKEGKPITPSVIYLGADGPVVGEDANDKQALGDEQVRSAFKREMGNATYLFENAGRTWSATDLSAQVLAKLKRDAEERLRRPIAQAVITVPAYFNNQKRQATIEAARLAGIEVLQIINEPTAAALAYGLRLGDRDELVMVFDLGGGTFDVTLIHITSQDFLVIGTDGDNRLGGKDWDEAVAEWFNQSFSQTHQIDLREQAVAWNDLLTKAESTKKALSVKQSAKLTLHYDGKKHSDEISRSRFEDLTRSLMERTAVLCEQVLKDSHKKWTDLTGVLLVGGSTRMPMVSDYVRRMSGKEPMTGVNVDEAVALGAAICAGQRLSERAPAGIPKYALPGKRRMRDVMSHSLGMIAESADGKQYINCPIIRKNLPVPSVEARPFQLATRAGHDNEMEVYTTQGESELPFECSFLGKYRFRGIEHNPSGVQIVDVCYAYDESGVVRVTGKERSSGRELPLTIEPVPEDMSWLDMPPGRGTIGHVCAYLVIDLSGSMAGEPLVEAKKAAREFVQQSDLSKCSIGLVVFSDKVQTRLIACQNAKDLEAAIDGMQVGASLGYGNAAVPFAHTQPLLELATGPKFMLVLTDGVWSYQEQAIREADVCKQVGIHCIAIGFGSADDAFLKQIATTVTAAFYTSLNDLTATFGSIARELTETAGGQAVTATAGKGLRFLGG